eukprot:6189087-Pleurochrysis_carterae.AAC.1
MQELLQPLPLLVGNTLRVTIAASCLEDGRLQVATCCAPAKFLPATCYSDVIKLGLGAKNLRKPRLRADGRVQHARGALILLVVLRRGLDTRSKVLRDHPSDHACHYIFRRTQWQGASTSMHPTDTTAVHLHAYAALLPACPTLAHAHERGRTKSKDAPAAIVHAVHVHACTLLTRMQHTRARAQATHRPRTRTAGISRTSAH